MTLIAIPGEIGHHYYEVTSVAGARNVVGSTMEFGQHVQVKYGHYAGRIGVAMEYTRLTDQYWVSFGYGGRWFQEYELELVEPPVLWTDILRDFIKRFRK